VTPRQLERLMVYAEELVASWTGRRALPPAPGVSPSAPRSAPSLRRSEPPAGAAPAGQSERPAPPVERAPLPPVP
jgi:hypothetical protein